MQLSQHFTLQEFITSPTATAQNIDNTPSGDHLENLKHVVNVILEPIRSHFGKPIKINSGYRSPALNKAVGGSKTSQHCNGEAVDFEIAGIPNRDVAEWITENLNFDQCILEFYNPKEGVNSGWVHVSIKRVGKQRFQKLVATKNGKTTKYQVVQAFP